MDANPEFETFKIIGPPEASFQSLRQDSRCPLQALDWHSGWGRAGGGVGEEGPDFLVNILKKKKKTKKTVPSCFEVGNLDTESTGTP